MRHCCNEEELRGAMRGDIDFFIYIWNTDFIKITAESQHMQKESESNTFSFYAQKC